MSTYVGGLRVRLINDSMFQLVLNGLGALGWFDTGARHRPIVMIAEPVRWDEEVQLNTVAVTSTNTTDDELELGSNAAENRHTFYIDFYAEDDSIGRHLIHDVRDVLRGKFPSISRSRPILPVYDFTLATPVETFVCEIENVLVDRAHDFPRAWQRHWFTVRCDVVDVYEDENDDTATTYTTWNDFGPLATWLDINDALTWETL